MGDGSKFAIGALFVVLCLWLGWDEVVIRLTGERATGTVVEVDDAGTEHAWWEFTATLPDGSRTTVVAEEYIWVFVPEVGDQGPVIYDPEDPENRAVFGSIPSPMEVLTVLFTLGALLLGMAMWFGRPRPATDTNGESAGPRPNTAYSVWRRAANRVEDRRRVAQRQAARQRSAQRRTKRNKG